MFLGERQWRAWSWGPPARVGRVWSWGLWAKAPQDHTGLMSPPPDAALSWGRPSKGPPSQHQEDQREWPPHSEFSAYERISLHLKREHQVFKLHPTQELRGFGHTTHPWENQALLSMLSQGSFLPCRPSPLPPFFSFLSFDCILDSKSLKHIQSQKEPSTVERIRTKPQLTSTLC